MAAFVVSASAFTPASSLGGRRRPALAGTPLPGGRRAPRPAGAGAPTTMAAGWSLDKYAGMAGAARGAPPPPPPSSMSAYQRAFLDSFQLKNAPYRGAADPEVAAARRESPAAVLARGGRALAMSGMVNAGGVPMGGDPDVDAVRGGAGGVAADTYMAACVRAAYKASAVPGGVYTTACTEGTVAGAADAARVAALSSAFRARQRSAAQKYGDYYEARRQATLSTGGCSYEEALLGAYPRSAAAMVRGAAEASRSCVRYGVPASPEEAYMTASVDAQMKARAAVGGVYAPSCTDGGAGGEAEASRVAALAARFRASQAPAGVRAQAKYDAAAYARVHFGHGCSYEEGVFDAYPAVAAAMRPSTARY